MKVEEIKLHFQKLNEQKIELALLDDLKKSASKFEPLMAKSLSLYNQTVASFKDAQSVLDDSEKLVDSGIAKTKELGIEDKLFSGFKNEILGQKAKVSNFLKRLNA
jgi:hypothetical protein